MTEEDSVDMARLLENYQTNEDLQGVMTADNPRDAKKYKSDQVLDALLLAFVHTKLDLYKKLTEPKVNEMLKRQWFEAIANCDGMIISLK